MKENADKARALDSAELHKQLRESSEQMFRLRFQMSMGQVDGLKKLRLLRREKARMLTVLRERELNPENAAPTPVKKSKAARVKSKSHDKSQAAAKLVKAPAAAKPKAAGKAKAAVKKASSHDASSHKASPHAASSHEASSGKASVKKGPVKKSAPKKASKTGKG
jgi:large subunit ribosomal protein L29